MLILECCLDGVTVKIQMVVEKPYTLQQFLTLGDVLLPLLLFVGHEQEAAE